MIEYPWPARCSPAAGQVERAARRWVLDHGLLVDRAAIERFDAARVGMRAALALPEAEPERLELIAEWMAWLVIEDDRYDRAPAGALHPEQLEARFEGYLDVLRVREVSAAVDPASRALGELCRRLRELASPPWWSHFCGTMRRYWMDGLVVETYYRSRGLVPDPASYMAMRVQSVGVYPQLDLMELVGGYALTPSLRADPILRRIAWLTSRLSSYVNDLASYDEEQRAGDVLNHLHVLHVTPDEATELEQASERLVRLHERELEHLQRLASGLHERDPESRRLLERHVAGCRSWLSGALRWHQLAPRYRSGRARLGESSSMPTARMA